MPTRVKFIDRDRGWNRVVRAFKGVKRNKVVTVGVHGGSEPYKRGGGQPATIPQIATFQEYGTKHIPSRSFIRSTFDEKKEEWVKLVTRLETSVSRGAISQDVLYNLLGIKIQSDIQTKIERLKTPPNSPLTIKLKGSANPLIDTGRMKNSITYEIKD